MTDSPETPKDEEVKELNEKERAVAWMNYVSDEVGTLLGLFLPISRSGTVGVKYNHVVVAVHESGPEYNPNVAESVEIRLVFEFEKAQEIPKPPEE